MQSKEFEAFLEERTKEIYKNPNSMLKEYDEFLASNDIYRSKDPMTFRKNIKGHYELCEEILNFYHKAKLDNEKISFLEDLYAIGYDKNKLVELILQMFESNKKTDTLWDYGDLLYRIRRYKYLPQYLKIIENKSYGINRQMVVLLVGKSKKPEVIPVLKRLLDDKDVYGHALEALANFKGDEIQEIMERYTDHNVTWIRNKAKRYLKKHW